MPGPAVHIPYPFYFVAAASTSQNVAIAQNGLITGVQFAFQLFAAAPAASAWWKWELSFSPAALVSGQDSKALICQGAVSQLFHAGGQGQGMDVGSIEGLQIPVAVGDRLYLHTNEVQGATDLIVALTAYVLTEETGASKMTLRNLYG